MEDVASDYQVIFLLRIAGKSAIDVLSLSMDIDAVSKLVICLTSTAMYTGGRREIHPLHARGQHGRVQLPADHCQIQRHACLSQPSSTHWAELSLHACTYLHTCTRVLCIVQLQLRCKLTSGILQGTTAQSAMSMSVSIAKTAA